MRLKTLELNGFKSFAKKTSLEFTSPITAVVGPNGSGKSNVVESIRFVLGEQSMKSMRGKGGADLIFKGSKSLSRGTRASVSIFFDNNDKIFRLENESGENMNMNYDTVSIAREVYADGLNKYSLNNTDVRLKDVNALLASVNIGSSGHHIISQGEADRVLNAPSRERREMIEDALGLKIYQYKIKEAERKLERTGENMKEVSLLRREIAPHLKFLRGQVEKFAKAEEMKTELLGLYRDYLKKESVYLEKEETALSGEKKRLEAEIRVISEQVVDEPKAEENKEKQEDLRVAELRSLEQKIYAVRATKSELERKLGRIEGMLELKEKKADLSGKCPLCGHIIEQKSAEATAEHTDDDLAELKNSKEDILRQTGEMEKEISVLDGEMRALRQAIDSERDSEREKEREQEREKYAYKMKLGELNSALNIATVKEENIIREAEAFENELKEGAALVGPDILSYKNVEIEGTPDRYQQEEAKRKIERLKIKLEDAGLGGGGDIAREYAEVSERDAFLAKEMEDLGKSIGSLQALMADLKEKIDSEFKDGVRKINKEFSEYFSLMFGGGHASLDVVAQNNNRRKAKLDSAESDDDGEIPLEQGIEINVSLPHKKVKELHALSGGERSLTSIALLFAMSQVNPPPFLVLDETDAALDEANSRKYGDMLEKLSKHSQLIVVTHNRETMSRAGALYGVTVGADGASKLLSVRFDEAAAIAK